MVESKELCEGEHAATDRYRIKGGLLPSIYWWKPLEVDLANGIMFLQRLTLLQSLRCWVETFLAPFSEHLSLIPEDSNAEPLS